MLVADLIEASCAIDRASSVSLNLLPFANWLEETCWWSSLSTKKYSCPVQLLLESETIISSLRVMVGAISCATTAAAATSVHTREEHDVCACPANHPKIQSWSFCTQTEYCFDQQARCDNVSIECCPPLVCQETYNGRSWCLPQCLEVGSPCGEPGQWFCGVEDNMCVEEDSNEKKRCGPRCQTEGQRCGDGFDTCCGEELECRVNTSPYLRCMRMNEPVVTSSPTISPTPAPTIRV